MATIQDYIDNNENIKIRIDAKESTDPCDPMIHTMWEGMLKNIPKKYRNLEVIDEGWMMNAMINSLAVYYLKKVSVRENLAKKKIQVSEARKRYFGGIKCQER